MEENKAMDYAITRTKAEGYLVDYLNKIEAEAKDMLLTEFNEKAYEEVVREEGRAEGRENTLRDNVESLMDTMKLTADQAMDALQIYGKDRDTIAKAMRK